MRTKLSICLWLGLGTLLAAQSREEKVRNDRKKVEAAGFWIYNDLAQGFAEAKRTGKPLFVIFRCIPCTECVKLDDDLVNQDKRVRPLLEKFVRVRVVSTNGLDLSLFQFDTDQSFAGFFLNADGTLYGRFGTRSHRTSWSDDVSIEGLSNALQGALELHAGYPKNKEALAGKKGSAPEVASPEKYPLLKDRYGPKLDYKNQVAKSCIHCHQIGDAQRQWHIDRTGRLPERILFSYPHPKALGLILDPKQRATVLRTDPGSLAEEAGFRKGDCILALAGQPLLSIADMQWVLHQTPAKGASLDAVVQRGDDETKLTWRLPAGWRQNDNISWRASTWPLRRKATGGLRLENITSEERAKLGLAPKQMAIRVQHVGQYGPHAAAKRAGFRKEDIVVSLAGRDDLTSESDWIAYVLRNHKPGDRVKVEVIRGGKRMMLRLPIQK